VLPRLAVSDALPVVRDRLLEQARVAKGQVDQPAHLIEVTGEDGVEGVRVVERDGRSNAELRRLGREREGGRPRPALAAHRLAQANAVPERPLVPG
jgi:hypothetical protein